MMHVSVMDIQMFHRAGRGECGDPLMRGGTSFPPLFFFFFLWVHQAEHGDGGRMKDHLLNLWREEEYLLKSDLRASS